MLYSVYKHTTPSGKVYIGITAMPVKRRWGGGSGYKRCPYFYRAIKKYGWENIKHEVLYEGLTEEEACDMEVKLIAEYKATDPRYGYNDLVGGTSGKHGRPYTKEWLAERSECTKKLWQDPSFRNRVVSLKTGYKETEEHKQHISEALKGKNTWSKGTHLSKERCKQMSELNLLKGIAPPRWEEGKHHTEEAKRKIGEAHRGFTPTPIPVKQILDGKIVATYISLSAAAKAVDGRSETIKQCAKGIRSSAYGYQWEFSLPKGEK